MKRCKTIMIYLVVYILLVLSLFLWWGIRNFGNVAMDAIMFTLNMPLESEGSGFTFSIIKTVILPSVVFMLCFIFLINRIIKRDSKLKHWFTKIYKNTLLLILVFVIWITALVYIGDKSFGIYDYFKNLNTDSKFIEENYVKPTDEILNFPNKKRNLIHIVLESAESSNQDKANGGLFENNYIPEMTKLAKENVSFTQSKNTIEGASVAPACGWTVSGLVAEMSGLPLKLYTYDDVTVDNSMGSYKSFLPGAISIGDLLEKQGYNNYCMCGSDITFGGTDKFFKQHGNYQLFDYNTAIEENKIDKDYKVWWGFEDSKLYEFAKEKIVMLSKDSKPFNFTMQTIDTHHVGGYKCELCEDTYQKNYANVWRCASKQLYGFINWIQKQDFYKDTTIVITGDHCSMDPDFYGDASYDKHHGSTNRKVYEVFINSVIEPKRINNRRFTTLDIFPTTLAAMGITIKGERLGLGTNLFSGEKTLSEIYGYESYFDELELKSKFYDEEILFDK